MIHVNLSLNEEEWVAGTIQGGIEGLLPTRRCRVRAWGLGIHFATHPSSPESQYKTDF